MGRFLSVDPESIPSLKLEDPESFNKLISNPQNWNRYAYVRNNPLQLIDPDGRRTRELSEDDIEDIVDQAKQSPGGSVGIIIAVFNNLGDDASVTGSVLNTGLRSGGVMLDNTTAGFLTSAKKVTKKGSRVTITGERGAAPTVTKSGLKIKSKLSFTVGVENGQPTLSNIKGFNAPLDGLPDVSIKKLQVNLSTGSIRVSGRMLGFIPVRQEFRILGYLLDSGDPYILWSTEAAFSVPPMMDLYGTGSMATACCTSR